MEYQKGDLIQAFKQQDENWILVHQCNCVTDSVAGFAKSLFLAYPQVYERYKSDLQRIKFGDWRDYAVEEGIIINLYSQYYPGSPVNGTDTFEIRMNKLVTGLEEISTVYNLASIHIPLINSGLASDPGRKRNLTDLEYFQTFIEPEIDHIQNITAWYL